MDWIKETYDVSQDFKSAVEGLRALADALNIETRLPLSSQYNPHHARLIREELRRIIETLTGQLTPIERIESEANLANPGVLLERVNPLISLFNKTYTKDKRERPPREAYYMNYLSTTISAEEQLFCIWHDVRKTLEYWGVTDLPEERTTANVTAIVERLYEVLCNKGQPLEGLYGCDDVTTDYTVAVNWLFYISNGLVGRAECAKAKKKYEQEPPTTTSPPDASVGKGENTPFYTLWELAGRLNLTHILLTKEFAEVFHAVEARLYGKGCTQYILPDDTTDTNSPEWRTAVNYLVVQYNRSERAQQESPFLLSEKAFKTAFGIRGPAGGGV